MTFFGNEEQDKRADVTRRCAGRSIAVFATNGGAGGILKIIFTLRKMSKIRGNSRFKALHEFIYFIFLQHVDCIQKFFIIKRKFTRRPFRKLPCLFPTPPHGSECEYSKNPSDTGERRTKKKSVRIPPRAANGKGSVAAVIAQGGILFLNAAARLRYFVSTPPSVNRSISTSASSPVCASI